MANAKTQVAEAYTCFFPCSSKTTDIGFSYTVRGEVSDIYELTPHSSPSYYHVSQTYWPHGAASQLSSNITGLPTISYGGTIGSTVGLDGEGRITQVTAASGQNPVTGVAYNNSSQPTQVTFGSADTDIFAYDVNTMRMTQYQFNINGQSSTGALTWNANSSLQKLAITDAFNSADNQTCNYSHDDLSRIAQADCGSGGWGQSFTYDPFGNITKNVLANHSGNSFQPTYSAATNKMTLLPGNFTPTYDANGNVTNDSNHTYAWDADGNSISLDGVGLTFDALDRMVEQNRSGTYTEVVYSPLGAKLALMTGTGGQTLQKAFVPLPGQATAVYNFSNTLSNAGFEQGFSGWAAGGTGTATLVTDPTKSHSGSNYMRLSGNPGSGPDVISAYVTVTPGQQVIFGGWTYLESGSGGTVSWYLEADNSSYAAVNWIAPSPSTVATSSWTYQSGTYTVPAGIAYVRVYCTIWLPTTASVARFDDAFLATSSGLDHYRHSDWLGSARLSSSPTRTVLSTTAYAPFGETYAQSGTADLSFTGQNSDTVPGDYDFLYREYSTQGRWASPDPAGLAAVSLDNPQSWNRYAYVLNNPLSAVDPLGLVCVWSDGSYDAADDPMSGLQMLCDGLGGAWIDDTMGGGWSDQPDAGLAQTYQNVMDRMDSADVWAIHHDVWDFGGGGGNTSESCIPSVFDPSCKPPTCPAVYVDAIVTDLVGDGVFHAASTGAAEPAVKAFVQDQVTNHIASRGLVVPLRSSIVRRWILAGEVAGEVLLAAPIYYSAVINFNGSYQAARAGTCRTIWSN
jgi:RHS repeat-associated protein